MTESEKSITAQEIKEIFQNQQDKLDADGKVLISHFGIFTQDLVSSLCASTEELLISSGDKRMLVKRLFSILIEGLQNIRIHGQRDEYGRQLGFVVVARAGEFYRILMANVIDPEDREKVESYLDKINDYTTAELKETYLAVLSNEFVSQKGGAGLGFITTRMKSENPLRYSFYQLKNGKMLFTFDVRMNREKE